MPSPAIGNNLGLYAFISLIPLIIFYLMRPKPIDKIIPALMFFISDRGVVKQHSFPRRLLRNLLLLIQILVLSLLSLALASPYITTDKTTTSENTVIVIDSSASMQTKLDSTTRFDKAMSEAKGQLEGKISIIIAENVPLIALESGSRDKAYDVLSSLKAKDTNTNLGDAMMLASDLLKGKKGRVVVISDFIATDGPEPLVVKRLLNSNGIEVRFIDVGTKAGNMGIVDLKVDKYNTKVYIKNFNEEEKTANLELVKDGILIAQVSKTVSPGSIETLAFETPAGASELNIKEDDDFRLDNKAYISGPETKKIKVLLITNAETSYVKTALLSSPDIDLKVAEPPVIPELDYSVIIIHRASKKLLLPGFYRDLSAAVEKGKNVVITANDDLSDFGSFLPVSLNEKGGNTKINRKIINQFTQDVEFGTASKYLKGSAVNNSIVVAEADDGSPMIALYGSKGTIAYYGIFDENSDFKNSASYPIFWNELVNFLAKTEKVEDYNVKTDKIAFFSEQLVETPNGIAKTSRLMFDRAGVYKIGEKKYTANLLNAKESDVSSTKKLAEEEKALLTEEFKDAQKISFEFLLVILAFMLIGFELLYIKMRGDI